VHARRACDLRAARRAQIHHHARRQLEPDAALDGHVLGHAHDEVRALRRVLPRRIVEHGFEGAHRFGRVGVEHEHAGRHHEADVAAIGEVCSGPREMR
jgi:hypothetical protein